MNSLNKANSSETFVHYNPKLNTLQSKYWNIFFSKPHGNNWSLNVYYFPRNCFCCDHLRTHTSMLLFFVFPGAPIIFPPCTNGAYPVILIRYKVFYVWITNHVKITSVPFHSYRWFLLRSSQSNPHKYLENTRNMFWKIPRKISSSGKLCIWIKICVLISHFFCQFPCLTWWWQIFHWWVILPYSLAQEICCEIEILLKEPFLLKALYPFTRGKSVFSWKWYYFWWFILISSENI